MKKPARPKKVAYTLIDRVSVIGHPMYSLLDELVEAHHDHLRDARIALAWCTSWKPDVDGRVKLGMCRKASDLDRELAQWDFIVLLSRAFWQNDTVPPHQRRALLDHELCHAEVKLDMHTGEPAEDERGRTVYRIRKHDLEEFTAIVERYGTYKKDLEEFAAALRRCRLPTFKPCEQCRDTPGWVSIVDDRGDERQARCACWLTWSEQIEIAKGA